MWGDLSTLTPGGDLPNWVTLLIGLVVGSAISLIFRIKDNRKKKKRRDFALLKIAEEHKMLDFGLSFLIINDEIDVIGIRDAQKIGLDIINISANNMRTYLATFSNDLDASLIGIINYLIVRIPSLANSLMEDSQKNYEKTLWNIVARSIYFEELIRLIKPDPVERCNYIANNHNQGDDCNAVKLQMNYLFYDEKLKSKNIRNSITKSYQKFLCSLKCQFRRKTSEAK